MQPMNAYMQLLSHQQGISMRHWHATEHGHWAGSTSCVRGNSTCGNHWSEGEISDWILFKTYCTQKKGVSYSRHKEWVPPMRRFAHELYLFLRMMKTSCVHTHALKGSFACSIHRIIVMFSTSREGLFDSHWKGGGKNQKFYSLYFVNVMPGFKRVYNMICQHIFDSWKLLGIELSWNL
jgi:hypothetical protein